MSNSVMSTFVSKIYDNYMCADELHCLSLFCFGILRLRIETCLYMTLLFVLCLVPSNPPQTCENPLIMILGNVLFPYRRTFRSSLLNATTKMQQVLEIEMIKRQAQKLEIPLKAFRNCKFKIDQKIEPRTRGLLSRWTYLLTSSMSSSFLKSSKPWGH